MHRHLTLEELADRVGMSHGAIQQLETGKTNYVQRTLEALAVALDCTPADLISRRPIAESPVARELVELFLQMSPEAQRNLVRIAETIVGERGSGVPPAPGPSSRR